MRGWFWYKDGGKMAVGFMGGIHKFKEWMCVECVGMVVGGYGYCSVRRFRVDSSCDFKNGCVSGDPRKCK